MIINTASGEKKLHLDFAPTSLALASGTDLWLLDLSKFIDQPHLGFAALLSADELTRASQFKHHSNHFITTRSFLRVVLAHYTQLNAHDLLFARGEHGKPFLTNSAVDIYFNLSHCGDFAVLAVNTQSEIGVDIESISSRDYLKIAKRYFHDRELKALQDCVAAERETLFYKLWTLKEAFFKATGGGIATGLDKVFFQFDDTSIKANFDSQLNMQESEWQFHQEFIATNTLVALTVNSATPIKYQWFDGNVLLEN